MKLPKISTLRVLEIARERISNIRNWTIGIRWGTGYDGAPQNCALGAIEYGYGFRGWACSQDASIEEAEPTLALCAAAKQLEPGITGAYGHDNPSSVVANFNNSRGHAKTLEAFDLAIANEKARIEREGQQLIETLEKEHDERRETTPVLAAR